MASFCIVPTGNELGCSGVDADSAVDDPGDIACPVCAWRLMLGSDARPDAILLEELEGTDVKRGVNSREVGAPGVVDGDEDVIDAGASLSLEQKASDRPDCLTRSSLLERGRPPPRLL